MAKKKSLKQLKANTQRTYASQSIAKKPAPESVPEESGSNSHDPEASTSQQDQQQQDGEAQGPAWDEQATEKALLQQLAERVRPMVTKEVARLTKMFDYERRLARNYPMFQWPKPDLQQQIIDMAREQNQQGPSHRPAGLTDEKLISRALTIYGVVERFGFSKERIEECLLRVANLELDDALEWLVLHCPDKELLFDAANALTASVQQEEQLDESFVSGASTPAEFPPLVSNANTNNTSSSKTSGTGTPKALSEEDTNAIRDRPTAAYVSATLELMSIQRKLISESDRSVPQLESIISQSGKAYLFDKRDADAAVKMGKTELDERVREMRAATREREAAAKAKAQEEEAAAKAAAAAEEERVEDPADTEQQQQQQQQSENAKNGDAAEKSSDVDADAGGGEEDVDGLFGNMLDEMPTEEVDEATNSTIRVRAMPLPKQFASKPPKLLLDDVVRRKDKFAAKPVYHLLGGGTRAKRASVTLRWEHGTQQVFTMQEEACPDVTQAHNYVATMALFAIDTASVGRQLAPAFRELWGELEIKKKGHDEQAYRDHLQYVKGLVEPRLQLPVAKAKAVAEAPVETGPSSREKKTSNRQPSESIQQDFLERQSRQSYMDMLQYRVQLPISAYRGAIIDAIEGSQVLVLCGETGCGKSTQVPSFILENELRQGRPVKVYCTEPRRISAISLAQRVSKELGDADKAVGTNRSLVGYNIRLEAKVSNTTRLTYATTGIVLRMLEGDRAFDEVTHLILDEVHERSIDSDFLLIIIKDLLRYRRDLKVILMSATVDAERLSAYMGNAPVISVPGRTFPVEHYFLEDAIEMTGYTLPPDSQYMSVNGKKSQKKGDEERRALEEDDDESDGSQNGGLAPTYSKSTRQTLELLDHTQINYDLLTTLLEQACVHSRTLMEHYPGAVLIFMPSLDSIRKMVDLLEAHPVFGTTSFEIYPLHSSVSSESQGRVFNVPPKGVRKIVVATNIAETGITIPDCTVVIDVGKHREMRYDEKRQISRLLETYVAKSNAMQRRGRAGRVQKGICFHMFSKFRFENQMADHPLPEMLRLSLQDLALRIKIMSLFTESIEAVFSKAFDPPSAANVQRAIAALQEVKALTLTEEITPLGRHLVKLPIDVHLGKMLLLACLFQCLDPALTVAATLSSKSPFITPFGREAEADTTKKAFKTAQSDFMTLHKAYTLYRESAMAGSHFSFCRKNFLSVQNLTQIEDLRNQFYDCLVDAGFVKGPKEFYETKARLRLLRTPEAVNSKADDPRILTSCLASGMYPKLLVTDASGVFRTLTHNAPASVHPSSINFNYGKKPDFGDARYAVYCNVIQTKKLYVWETGPVDEAAVLLMCGNDIDIKYPARTYSLDKKIKVRLPSKSALALKTLRRNFLRVFDTAMKHPGHFESNQHEWWSILQDLIKTEPSELEQKAKEAESKLTVR